MALITYDDKVALNENPDIPLINKITAGDMNEIKNAINNLIYPVGTYYETSDTSFDPNVTWGGTWQLDSAGRVTVSHDANDSDFDTIGETGGSKYIQAHQHAVNYSTQVGNTEGRVALGVGSGGTATGTYGYAVNSNMNVTTGNSGNLQPYIVVNRWHRTA